MSPAVSAFLLIFTLRFVSSTATTDAVPDSATCPTELVMFVYNLQSQCHPSISSNPPLQVDGNFVERALTSGRINAYTSVFFYASWCPFSQSMRPKFESLAAMFPQIEHLAVEQSYAFPRYAQLTVFSRYGVHSFPSILLVNQTMKVRYRGPKDLQSLMQFYVKTTGLEPVQHLTEAEATNLQSDGNSILQPWDGSPLEQVLRREPYLALSILFLCFRVMLFFSPKLLLHLKSFCSSNIPRLNLGMFGETSQLFERILHLVDVRRVWTKLRLCKARNFREGAKNCRVLASSFASVSLGESSSSTARS
ncbi:5'-adenylylsulfate reductase-like 5 [Linum perenne]